MDLSTKVNFHLVEPMAKACNKSSLEQFTSEILLSTGNTGLEKSMILWVIITKVLSLKANSKALAKRNGRMGLSMRDGGKIKGSMGLVIM